MTTALPNPCEPGRYVFPFKFTLPDDLPGVLDAHSLEGDVSALHATIKYTLKATVKVAGRFVSDLEAIHNLVVRELSEQPVKFHAVERTVSKRVKWLRVLSRGTCHVAVSMARNMFRLGENAQIECFVNNHTSAVPVRYVKCRLYQDVTLRHPAGTNKVCTRPIMQLKYQGPTAGDLLERTVHLPMAMKVRFPSTQGAFLTCAYRISLECEHSSTSPPIRIDIPIVILPPLPASPSARRSSSSASSSPPSSPVPPGPTELLMTDPFVTERLTATARAEANHSLASRQSVRSNVPRPSRQSGRPSNAVMSPRASVAPPSHRPSIRSNGVVSPRQSIRSNRSPQSPRRSIRSNARQSMRSNAGMSPRQSMRSNGPPIARRSTSGNAVRASAHTLHPYPGSRPPPPPVPASRRSMDTIVLKSSDFEEQPPNALTSSTMQGLEQQGIVDDRATLPRTASSPLALSDNLSVTPQTLPRGSSLAFSDRLAASPFTINMR